MGVLRYLGGIGTGILGMVFLVAGIASLAQTPQGGLFFIIFGIIIIWTGKYYSKTALRYTPVRLEFEKEIKPKDKKEIKKIIICPKCDDENSYNASYCSKCGNKLKNIKNSK